MAAAPMSDRMDRVESQLEGQNAKLDLIIRLTEAQDEKIKALTTKVESMAPTVELGQRAISTAGALGWVGKRVLWASAGIVGFLFYMQDKWAIVGQLFRKAG